MSQKEPSGVTTLLERLDLERLDRDLFRGYSPDDGRPRAFGGQVAAQSLVAAVRCVEEQPGAERWAHSLHAYFLRPGDPKRPIIYEVDRIRDGRSFTTRRVVAIQEGEAIFLMSASFHREEPGLSHQIPMPDVPPPESVPSNDEIIREGVTEGAHPFYSFLAKLERPMIIHDLEPNDPANPQKCTGPRHVWFRSRGNLPDDRLLHQCVLTYASDLTLPEASLRIHGRTWFERTMMVASLDHTVWFHRPFRADEWMLYQTDSPSTEGSRGLNFGHVFQDGNLVASVVQESLMREVDAR